MRKALTTLTAVVAALALAAPATAATTSLFGGATQSGSTITLVSNLADTNTANDFSGVQFTNLGTLKMGDLKVLATEFNATDDGCGGGSPRFAITFANGKTVQVYLGERNATTGNFDCPLNTWVRTGNLVGTTDLRVDTSQIGGTFYDTWANAVRLAGSETITAIRLITDSGWFFADKEQTTLVRNALVNTTIAGSTFAGLNPSKACKAQRELMGPAAFAALYGTSTSNQRNAHGKCVSAMAKARTSGSMAVAQATITSAAVSCKASGKSGRALGQCVRGQAATFVTVAKTTSSKGKGKKRP